ncbi:MAG TPA: DoxX family protein [Gammaproteobacteria bacterium]|nr:DoxX family protein [Gammaproteobacteria bacterium]
MSNKTVIIGRTLSALAIVFMVFDVGIKLAQLPIVAQTMADLGYAPDLGLTIGIVELVCLVLYVVPRTAVLGAILLTAVFGGAIATHVRVDSPLFSHVLFGVYLGLLVWGGLYLRNPRLRGLIPAAA